MAIDPKVTRIADLQAASRSGSPACHPTTRRSTPRSPRRGSSATTSKSSRVGYSLLPALLAHRVDAVIGVYRNVEGIELERRGLQADDHPARPGRRSLLRRARARRELVAPALRPRLRGHRAAVRARFRLGTTGARSHPARSLAILRKATGSDAGFLAKATPATLALLAGTARRRLHAHGRVDAVRRLDARAGVAEETLTGAP